MVKDLKELRLYPFQQEDVTRMNSMPHVLLFSDMGIGKTIEAIWHITSQEPPLLPCLILCPKTLKLNWYDEIEKWQGIQDKKLPPPYYAETADEIVEYYYSPEGMKNRKRFYILHHEALAYLEYDPVREVLPKISWKCVVIDEAHRFRNPNTLRTEALFNFTTKETPEGVIERQKTPKFLFLTGTPIINSTFDIFFILKMLKYQNSEENFLSKYTRGYKTQWGYKIIGSTNVNELLSDLAPIYIRRTKEEVLKDLPPKIYQVIRLEMPPDQRKIYDHFVEMLCIVLDSMEDQESGPKQITAANVLAELTRLRQINLDPTILGKRSDSSKTKAIIDLINQSPREKWVVASTSKLYTNFMARKLEDALPHTIPCKVLTLTGDTPSLERQEVIKTFSINPNYNVLLMTMQTGGLGINLQASSNIIITDPWWNQATIDQTIDRLHRIGQHKPVLVYELENENSIDQKIKEAIREKSQLASEIVISQDVIRQLYKDHRGYDL